MTGGLTLGRSATVGAWSPAWRPGAVARPPACAAAKWPATGGAAYPPVATLAPLPVNRRQWPSAGRRTQRRTRRGTTKWRVSWLTKWRRGRKRRVSAVSWVSSRAGAKTFQLHVSAVHQRGCIPLPPFRTRKQGEGWLCVCTS